MISLDKLNTIPWRIVRLVLSSQQDNRVRIPDGTAAVCAKRRSFGESQSLGNWEGRAQRGNRSSRMHESEDLRIGISPPCAEVHRGGFVTENRPWHHIACGVTVLLFLEDFL